MSGATGAGWSPRQFLSTTPIEMDDELALFLCSLRDGLIARNRAGSRVHEAVPNGQCWWHFDPSEQDETIWEELEERGEELSVALFQMLQNRVARCSDRSAAHSCERVAMVIAMTVALADGCSPSLRRVLCRELEISAVGQERYGGGQ